MPEDKHYEMETIFSTRPKPETEEEEREEAAYDDMIMNAFANNGGRVVHIQLGPEDTPETADSQIQKEGVNQRPKQR